MAARYLDDASRYGRAVAEIDRALRAPVAAGACPVCAGAEARPRFTIEAWPARVVVCTRCGTGRLHPLPDAEALASLYPASYYGDLGAKFRGPFEWLARLLGSRQVRFLSAGLPPGARVLDVGCGRGIALRALADRGFEAHGVERDAAAAADVDPRARIRIAETLADAGYPEASFDAVIVWHVLEHLREPAATVAEIRRILRPGGRLVVAVPNFASWQARWAGPAWFHLDLPRHLHHFPLAALREMLDHHGFEVVSEHHFSLRQNPFGWIQSGLNRRPNLPRNGLYRLLYRHGPAAAAPFDPRTRRALWAGFALAAVPSLVLAIAEAVFRSGATVHVVCRKRS